MTTITLKGALGKALARTVENRLKTVDYTLLEEPFVKRNEADNAWRCEFWGKTVRSAVYAAYFSGDADLRKKVDDTVGKIIASQTADGCISSYPAEKQTDGWDIWGRKYVLLALMRYYEVLNSDPAVLKACCGIMEHFMSQIGPGKKEITACGWHDGLAASSILGAVVNLWRLTGQDKYRDFARYIIDSGCSSTGNIFQCVLSGIVPAALGNGKAYEMTSCFQGLAEYILLEENSMVQESIMTYYKAVRDREIFITGVGGAHDTVGEFWYDGALRQTRGDSGALGETCVITTWIRFCAKVLALSDDCTVADEIEKSLYNGILGAIGPDGSHWMHANPTPLTGGGFKHCAEDQIFAMFATPYGGNDCCRAQGPEALALAPSLAVTENNSCITVNFFEALEYGPITVSGNYPWDNVVRITVAEAPGKALRIRTPEFLRKVSLNGRDIDFVQGKYLTCAEAPAAGDVIELEFDFALREITAPGDPSYVAVKRGPIVLAEDSRGFVPEAELNVEWKGRNLCEYAAAGSLFCKDNTLTVWFKK